MSFLGVVTGEFIGGSPKKRLETDASLFPHLESCLIFCTATRRSLFEKLFCEIEVSVFPQKKEANPKRDLAFWGRHKSRPTPPHALKSAPEPKEISGEFDCWASGGDYKQSLWGGQVHKPKLQSNAARDFGGGGAQNRRSLFPGLPKDRVLKKFEWLVHDAIKLVK